MSMTMTVPTTTWWSNRKFGCTSLALSLAETLIIYGAAVLVQTSAQPHASPLILKMVSITWLVGSLCSFGFAVAGLAADSRRMTAFVAIIVTIAAFFICGLQVLV